MSLYVTTMTQVFRDTIILIHLNDKKNETSHRRNQSHSTDFPVQYTHRSKIPFFGKRAIEAANPIHQRSFSLDGDLGPIYVYARAPLSKRH